MRKFEQLAIVDKKLTDSSYDMYKDIDEKLAAKRGVDYTDGFICGLPVGLELPNGVTIGAEQESARL